MFCFMCTHVCECVCPHAHDCTFAGLSLWPSTRLLVGAPRGSYSNPDWAKGSQMKQTGILYQCPLKYTDHGSHSSHGSHGNCHQLPVDTRGELRQIVWLGIAVIV